MVYTGCRDFNVYALDAAAGAGKWKVSNAGSWVNSTLVPVDDKVIFATAHSNLTPIVDAATGKLIEQQFKAYVFYFPAVAVGFICLGVPNGTLEARSLTTGELRWDYRNDASLENGNWALTADRKLNSALLFPSFLEGGAHCGVTVQHSVGPFFSSQLIVNGVV